MDKVKEFFQGSSKPAEETQAGDKPGIQHQRVDSSVTPADTKSPDEPAQAPEDKTADQPSGEAGQALGDAGLTETQPELLEASKDQPSREEAQNKAAENAPSLDAVGEGQQTDTGVTDQEHGDASKLKEDDPAAQGLQAEPGVSKGSPFEPTKLGEDVPAVQDSQAGLGDSNISTTQPDQEHGDPTKLREDDPAAQDSQVGVDEPKADPIVPSQEHGDSAAQDTQAESVVPTTQSGAEPEQQGGGTVLGSGALDSSKPDEPTGQEQSESKPQESLGEEQPQAVASDEPPATSVTEGGLNEDRPQDGASTDAAGTGLTEAKDAGIHETQPDILEASRDGNPSIDDAQTKAEENAPDVGQSADQAPIVGESENRGEAGVVAAGSADQPIETRDDTGPSAQGIAGGALASSDGPGKDLSRDNDQLPGDAQQESHLAAPSTSTDKPGDDVPQQTEQPLSTGGTEAQDAGLSQPEVSEPSQAAGVGALDTTKENAPDAPAETQQPLTSESQDRPAVDEPKEDQGQSQPGLSDVGVGGSQLDTPAGDSKPADVPGTQHESLVDAGGPPPALAREEPATTGQSQETPIVDSSPGHKEEVEQEQQKEEPIGQPVPAGEGPPGHREEVEQEQQKETSATEDVPHGHEAEGHDEEGDADKKPKLTERLKEKVKSVVHKSE